MADDAFQKAVRLLSLIANPPNRRTKPLPTDPQDPAEFWFDGGTSLELDST